MNINLHVFATGQCDKNLKISIPFFIVVLKNEAKKKLYNYLIFMKKYSNDSKEFLIQLKNFFKKLKLFNQ